MQLKNIFSIALAATAVFASPVERRDLPTVNNAITAVQTALSNLDTAIKGLTAANAASQVTTLTDLSNKVLTALQDGTKAITAGTALDLPGALSVAGSTQGLTNQANTTVGDLITAKPLIDGAGQTKVTLDQLTAQRTATKAFGDAINGKVPAIAAAAGAAIAAQALAVIDRGIVAYGGTPPKRL